MINIVSFLIFIHINGYMDIYNMDIEINDSSNESIIGSRKNKLRSKKKYSEPLQMRILKMNR